MEKEKNVFLIDDIVIEYFEYDNPERYEFTKKKLSPADYLNYEYRKNPAQSFLEWADENLTQEELYEIPMMNALRYFPHICSFTDEDRYKTASNTTLLYDTEKGAWAVGMTGGGMDLSPHLLDTFIELGKGVPIELATGIRKNYNAYVNLDKHLENCISLAKAFTDKAKQFAQYAKDLI